MKEKHGIDYFGHNLPFGKLHMNSALKVRRKIYQWIKTQVPEIADKIFLDHGSTPDTSRQDNNCFIRWLLEDGATVYAFSLEDISHLERVFPGLIVVPQGLDVNYGQKVDYVVSSAVLEHVGSEVNQVQYLQNLLTMGDQIFLTTPNRYHWLEFHTKIPFLHWLPRKFHRRLLKIMGMNFWSQESNLHLLSKKDLCKIIETALDGSDAILTWYKPKFLGAVSNLVVFISRIQDPE